MSKPPFMDPERYDHRSCGLVIARECRGPICEECQEDLRESLSNVAEALKRLFTLVHELDEGL